MGKKDKQGVPEEKKKPAEQGGERPSQRGNEMVTVHLPAMTTSLPRDQAFSLYMTLGAALGIEGIAPAPPPVVIGGCPECGATTGCSHMGFGAEG